MRKSVLAVLLVTTLLVGACGPAMLPSGSETTAGGEIFTIALPRIIVDFDAQGTPSIDGIDLAAIASLTGSNINNFRLNTYYVNWMMAANVQHLELAQTGQGLLLLVDGKLLPYVSWSDDSLVQAANLVSALGEILAPPPAGTTSAVTNTSLIANLLPIVRRLGLDVVLRFPRRPGAAEIPLADPAQFTNLKPAASTAPASVVVHFEVKYDQSGAPGILGITATQLRSNGVNLGATNLSPNAISVLQRHNIQNLELRSRADGLFIFVNGQALPNIAWDDNSLANAAAVYQQMNSQNFSGVAQMLPFVDKGDVAVLIHFPVPQGVAVMPAMLR
jgi:hypothetical protein